MSLSQSDGMKYILIIAGFAAIMCGTGYIALRTRRNR